MFQEKGPQLALGPEVHSIGKKLCWHCVYTQKVPHKNNPFDFLQDKTEISLSMTRPRQNVWMFSTFYALILKDNLRHFVEQI